MKIKLLILALIIFSVFFFKYGRSTYVPVVKKMIGKQTIESVRAHLKESVDERLKKELKKSGFDQMPTQISLLVFKEEQRIEVYGWSAGIPTYIKAYDFTAYSGKLGPKLKEGDKQIPEGIYQMEYLNPNSSYYLSIKVNYPNEFDREKAELDNRHKLGGDIFIHGKAVTIGCVPIGDSAIEELFLLAANARKKNLSIVISPRDFRKKQHFPVIDKVDWEIELYKNLVTELHKYQK